MLELAETESGILFLDGDAVKAQFAHRRSPIVAREPVLRVDPHGKRLDPLRRKTSGRSRIMSAVSPSEKSSIKMS